MDFYEVVLTDRALAQLKELRSYISRTLMAPDTALAYVRAIKEEAATLSQMPARYMLVDEEPEHSAGIRKLVVKNFFVYYQIDEDARRVNILNVIYARRDQLKALTEKTP